MDVLLPSELWSLILSYVTNIADINRLFLVDKLLNNLVPKSIVQIDESDYIFLIPYSKIINFHNIRKCSIMVEIHDKLSNLLSWDIAHIASTTDIISSTWVLPNNFENKTHILYTRPNNIYPYTRCLSYSEGIINIETNDPVIHELMRQTSNTRMLIFRETAAFNPHMIVDYFSPNNIGLQFTEYQPYYCLCFLNNNSNIKYVGVDVVAYCMVDFSKFGKQCYLDRKVHPCYREISINLPILYNDFPKLLECFPNLKSALIVTSINTVLPTISDIKINGYDPKLNIYF